MGVAEVVVVEPVQPAAEEQSEQCLAVGAVHAKAAAVTSVAVTGSQFS